MYIENVGGILIPSFIFLTIVQTAAAEIQAEKHKKAVDRKKLKQRKRKVKILAKVQHDDVCFRCAEGGELVMCDHKNCPKAYCLGCLKLTKPPHGNYNMRSALCVIKN